VAPGELSSTPWKATDTGPFRCGFEGPVVALDDADVEGLLADHLPDDGGVWLAFDVPRYLVGVERADVAQVLGVRDDLLALGWIHERRS